MTPLMLHAMRAELTKLSFTTSQYSGPLSYGAIPSVSSLPDPGQASALQTGLASRTAQKMRGGSIVKAAEVSPASGWDGSMYYGAPSVSSMPDPTAASSLQAELARRVAQSLEKRGGSALTPAGRLAQTRRVGAPKMSPAPGPSIATIAKPKGPKFGGPIAGAKKGTI